ncbi:MAG: quinone-dependent dihydroorotate dehydrogenase [Saprospiraceae bacterium]|nr:quinone-dependent dihydroorotate dehydrogenase [Saprospiraceae bacterium]
MYRYVIKPIMFLFDPERAHYLTISMLKIALLIPGVKWIFRYLFTVDNPKLNINLWGLDFPNRIGLAAGFDKDGKCFENMAHLGFGFIEIGTVTPKPQEGNLKPRLFRLPADRALINRMGFNNDGVEALVNRLKNRRTNHIIIGGNIGKNKSTDNENATADYLFCFESLYLYVDYFVINVSSPNTPGLRELQEKEPLSQLLSALVKLNLSKPKARPILLKISPDLTNTQLDDIIEIVHHTGIQGIIATNTTLDRNNIISDTDQIGAGGLSGFPLKNKSTEMIRYIHHKSGGQITIIGVGGINNPEDAMEKLQAGASLIQVYSGLVFEGPGLVKKINAKILASGM